MPAMEFHTRGCRDRGQLACWYACSICFSHPSLTARVDAIPRRISSPKIEHKLMTSTSANFTGCRDYLTKLRDYFSVKPDELLCRETFLLYGMGDIGKAQICGGLGVAEIVSAGGFALEPLQRSIIRIKWH